MTRLTIGELVLEVTAEQEASLRAQLGVVSTEGAGYLTAEQLAERLGFSRDYVYSHARELGGWKPTDSPRAHWRFPIDAPATKRPAPDPSPVARPVPRRQRRADLKTDAPLLRVRG